MDTLNNRDSNKLVKPSHQVLNIMTVAHYGQTLTTKVIVDSGASRSYLTNKNLLRSFFDSVSVVGTAQRGSILKCLGFGLFRVNNSLEVPDCYYCPDMAMNLLSVSSLCDLGLTVIFTANKCTIMKGKKSILIAGRENNLYTIEVNESQNTACYVKDSSELTELWHRRMGHLNYRSVAILTTMAKGIIIDTLPKSRCECCVKSKFTRKSFKPSDSHASRCGELIHSDVIEMQEKSLNEYKFIVTFMDDYSRFITIFLLKQKSEVYGAFKEYDKRFHNINGRHITTLRSDGRSNPTGTEYHNTDMNIYCKEYGIHQESSCAYTPEENGRAERINRTIVEGMNA
jgi:hypothetical protein